MLKVKKLIFVASLSALFLTIGGIGANTNSNNSFGNMTAYAAEYTTPTSYETRWELQSDKVTWKYKENGVYMTGWKLVDGKWYYMNEQGIMLSNTWIQGMYYVGADGAMLTNTITPDGYYVGSDGAWIPNYTQDDSDYHSVSTASKVMSSNKTENNVEVQTETVNTNSNVDSIFSHAGGRCTRDTHTMDNSYMFNIKSN